MKKFTKRSTRKMRQQIGNPNIFGNKIQKYRLQATCDYKDSTVLFQLTGQSVSNDWREFSSELGPEIFIVWLLKSKTSYSLHNKVRIYWKNRRYLPIFKYVTILLNVCVTPIRTLFNNYILKHDNCFCVCCLGLEI